MVRRRWFQFSLRSFLVIVTLGCAVLAWRVEPEIRQREAVKAIMANGGQFAYIVDQDDATHTYDDQYVAYDFELKAPKWPPIILNLNDKPIGRDELRMISRLTSLQLLDISDSHLACPDEDLTALCRLANLRNLWLPRVSKETIERLKGLLPRCSIYWPNPHLGRYQK